MFLGIVLFFVFFLFYINLNINITFLLSLFYFYVVHLRFLIEFVVSAVVAVVDLMVLCSCCCCCFCLLYFLVPASNQIISKFLHHRSGLLGLHRILVDGNDDGCKTRKKERQRENQRNELNTVRVFLNYTP